MIWKVVQHGRPLLVHDSHARRARHLPLLELIGVVWRRQLASSPRHRGRWACSRLQRASWQGEAYRASAQSATALGPGRADQQGAELSTSTNFYTNRELVSLYVTNTILLSIHSLERSASELLVNRPISASFGGQLLNSLFSCAPVCGRCDIWGSSSRPKSLSKNTISLLHLHNFIQRNIEIASTKIIFNSILYTSFNIYNRNPLSFSKYLYFCFSIYIYLFHLIINTTKI